MSAVSTAPPGPPPPPVGATLAAPWPMIDVQPTAVLAVAGRRRAIAGAAVLLAAASLSAVSGFLDGQLARSGLSPPTSACRRRSTAPPPPSPRRGWAS